MLILNNNIYIVDGAKKDCIYDLNANLLYHINKEASWLLNHLDTINDNDKTYNKYKEYINNLIEASIIVTDKKDLVPKIVPMNNTIDFAWIEITKQCNLRCLHCYADSDCTCIDEMTFDDFCYVIDELTAYKIKTIQIIGGEPFVNKRLYDMLNYCYGKFQKIEIFTNGTLITDEWIHFLYKHKIQLALSVYSYIASEHDKVTQRIGAYEKTISTIQKAKNKGIPYRICNVLMNDISLGEKNTNAFTLNPNKDIVRMSGRGNIKLLNKNLIQKKLITEKTFSKPINQKLFFSLQNGHNCFSNKLYISATLDIYPCVMERRIKHDNLKGKHLKKILNPDILFLKKDNIKICNQCEFRYCCFDCRPDSINEDYTEKPWYCTYNPYKAEWANKDLFIDSIINST